MTDFAPISPANLADRRRWLRRQRRLRALRALWRSLLVCGLAGGTIWVTTLPIWVIRHPSQIQIEGNELLSTQTVQSLLPIAYPQSLLTLQPQTIAQQLETQSPIENAIVTRHLFPPSLTVRVKERHPVALIYPVNASPVASQPAAASQVGVLDAEGTWTPLESYTSLNQPFTLPTLRVIGTPSDYEAHWKELYQVLTQSPVKVTEVNWQDPGNLILTTELGVVHFGPYSSRFAIQLRTLDQMRYITEKTGSEQIIYIDLKNPATPLVQTVQPSTGAPSEAVESDPTDVDQ
ncbi:FtsQ-type POTRA domain-containing protein [Oscillatoria sp. FACHB-1407]|uniref:cell division protein FtsQ/DivIB n=1 Tax=Oscillatoria sp. FACHB-1407 TaxID=2692847 RepID=UPI0016830A7B|nr:FtsQ-type POTRA domain-containing protein [Oscillatoria sp. FACHB-1407]MBD2461491.1 FtsQ-type POTRA domain-containing protein [Oscillatoria sp. FACHB-1407]